MLVLFSLYDSPVCQESMWNWRMALTGFHVLRLEREEWRAMCYRHVKGRRDTTSVCFAANGLALTI